MESARRGGIGIVFIAFIALVALAAVVPAASVGWRSRGYTGLALDRGSAVVREVDPGSPAATSGVRAGDRIVPDSFSAPEHVALVASRPGFPFAFVVDRDGRRIPIAITAVRKPSAYTFSEAILIVTETASFAVFVILGALLAALRPGPMTYSLFAFGICTAPLDAIGPYYATAVPTALAVPVFILTRSLFAGWSVLPLLPFVLRFPSGDLTSAWRRTANRAALAFVLVGFAYYVALAVHDASSFDRVAQIENDLPALVAFASALGIVIAGVATSDGVTRQRMRWAVVGMSVGFIAFITDYIPKTDSHIDPIANTLAVIMPLSLAYAVFKNRLIDVRVFVSRAAVYAASTTVLVVTIGLLEWTMGELVGETHVATYLTAAISVLIGLVFDRVHSRTQDIVEAVIFRDRSEAEAYLRLITRGLRFAETSSAVDEAMTIEPCRSLKLVSVTLYRLDERDRQYAPVAFAGDATAPPSIAHDAEWIRRLHSEAGSVRVGGGRIAVPMLQGAELFGFVLIAPHRDGSEIDPVELRALESLVRTGGIALNRIEAAAARTRITELEARVAALEA